MFSSFTEGGDFLKHTHTKKAHIFKNYKQAAVQTDKKEK